MSKHSVWELNGIFTSRPGSYVLGKESHIREAQENPKWFADLLNMTISMSLFQQNQEKE